MICSLDSQAGAVIDAADQARVCSNADGKSVYLLAKQLAGDCPQDWLTRISADTPADAQLKIEHEIIGAVTLVDGFPWSLFPLRQQTHVWCNLSGCSPGLISPLSQHPICGLPVSQCNICLWTCVDFPWLILPLCSKSCHSRQVSGLPL